jgi:hypothetical protein
VRLPAAQLRSNDASVILYDPGRGTKEFFLLEYRTPVNTMGLPWGDDRSLKTNGLVIWQVQHTADKDLDLVAPHQTGPSGQIGWAACLKCEGLYFRPRESISRCPDTTGGNNHAGSPNLHDPLRYGGLTMVHDDPADLGQSGWRICRKCQGLFYGPNKNNSNCPAGGTHDDTGSPQYTLRFSGANSPPAASDGWLWCSKCESLFYATAQTNSNCPDVSGGPTHDGSASSAYSMWQYDRSVFTVSYPDLSRGDANHWPGARRYQQSRATFRSELVHH